MIKIQLKKKEKEDVAKVRRVAKDKKYKTVPKKYLSGTKGKARRQRAKDLARMQRLYKQGKKIPRSLFKRVFYKQTMPHTNRKKSLLKKHKLSGTNKARKTPNHKTKSHIVLAEKGHKIKLIRFGQQGVKGAGKNPRTKAEKARRASFKKRHAKGIAKGVFSGSYWSNKVKW